MNEIEVSWTGKYPNLCSGHWKISFNGKSMKVPSPFINSSMGTDGIYSSWHFEDWMEVFEDYEDGIECEEWLGKNVGWIKSMFESIGVLDQVTKEDLIKLYNEIQEKDWRYLSCGGCI